ncbi:ESX secretion-associated protein EspG [Mycobacteroides abscessus]|uniref:ESX secretion-associated protein EspG n=1 Tax=Mycobacteroides abscessus TaxID=36809 RepID=UPI001896A26E
MFSARHWDFLHRQGLVVSYPARLGLLGNAPQIADDQIRRDLVTWGNVEETGNRLRLSASHEPVFEAFRDPPVQIFGSMLLHRDSVPMPDLGPEVPERFIPLLKAMPELVPQSKFLVAVAAGVVASAVQYRSHVAVDGVDCTRSDPIAQAARLLWEKLVPGEPYETMQEMTFPASALRAVSKVRINFGDPGELAKSAALARAVLESEGVPSRLAASLVELLVQKPEAAAQVCVSAVANLSRAVSEDRAITLTRFKDGAVLSVPSWRLDGSCYITYMPATPLAWEKALAEFVSRYQRLANIA